MKKFRAFTLSEIMIALSVLGVICAIVLPSVVSKSPNKNKMMMKKAYYTTSEVISELINNTNYYPTEDGLCPDTGSSGYIGFDCASTTSKLPYLFASSLNLADGRLMSEDDLASGSSAADCYGAASSCYKFETNDGMFWAFPKSSFTKGDYASTILIGVDVNGEKAPNCYQGSTSCEDKTSNFDQFRIKLYGSGKMEINSADTWAIEAIQVSSSLTD